MGLITFCVVITFGIANNASICKLRENMCRAFIQVEQNTILISKRYVINTFIYIVYWGGGDLN
jgi:hypothetical protein